MQILIQICELNKWSKYWGEMHAFPVREQPFDFYGGVGAGRLMWAGEFFLPIFGGRRIFFAGPSGRIIFFKTSKSSFSLNRGGGGGGGGVLKQTFQRAKLLPSYDANSHFLTKVYDVVLGVSETVYGVRKADFRLRKHISDCERRNLECENRFRSAKALPKASRRIFFAGPSGRRIFFP